MNRKYHLPLLIGIILLGTFLRLYQIDAVAFRGDEAYTVQNWSLRPLADTLQSETVTRDPHPPLAYASFRWWYLLSGGSEFAVRSLPTLINLLGIAAMYALGKRLGHARIGLIAAFLWAIHPFEIWHSQDARNYAIWAGLSATALWLGIRALEKQRWRDWLLYAVAAIIAAYIYYLEVFMLVAFNAYVVLYFFWKWFKTRQTSTLKQTILQYGIHRWFIADALIALSLAPWYLQSRISSGGGYTGTTFNFEADRLFTWFLPTLNFGSNIPPDLMSWLGGVVLIILLIGLWLHWHKSRRHVLLLIGIMLLPMLFLAIVSSRLNVFTPRYIMGVIPIYGILAATIIDTAFQTPRRVLNVLGVIVFASWLLMSGYALNSYYFNFTKAPDWRSLAQYLQTNTQADELVIQTGVDPAFGYYYATYAPAAREIALPVSPDQNADEIELILADIHDEYTAIWVVGRTFPDWAGAGAVENWLDEHMQRVQATNFGNLPAQQYRLWDVASDELRNMQAAIFADTASLIGSRILPTEPDDTLTIWLYWQPIATTGAELKVFVHLVGAINPATGSPLWSQDDHFPQNGRISTTTWATDNVYRDIFALPLADVPAGEYELFVGFYDPNTGTRIVTSANEDAVSIGTLIIR